MKIREITENVMPTIQTKTVTQAVMPDGSVADLDTDAGNKSTGTLFQDKDGNIGIAEPGKALEPGQTPADSNLVADPKKLKMTMDKQQKDAEIKAKQDQQKPQGTTNHWYSLMKISDLIQSTFTTNEEAEIMKKIDKASPFEGFTERQQVIIEQLVRKSLVSKFKMGSTVMVVKNGEDS